MTDDELVAALRVLGPTSRIAGQVVYAGAALELAGLDVERVARWAAANGGGRLDAGAVKLRKGQRPEQGRVGRAEAFVAVPESALA